MKHLFLLLFAGLLAFSVSAQEPDEEETYSYEEETEEPQEKPPQTKEIGVDANFSAIRNGLAGYSGTAGVGVKFAIVQKERLAFGPSIRFQRSWQRFNGQQMGYSVYGGGVFVHARFYNYFFLGGELEFLSSPVQFATITTQRRWVPTALVGGGFSRAFGKEQNIRINGGIMYDLINHVNSPFRQGYFMKNSQGAYLPLLYRIAFFFPI